MSGMRLCVLALLCACGPRVGGSDGGIDTDVEPGTTSTSSTSRSDASDDESEDTACDKCDLGSIDCEPEELPPVDVLLVVDNSVSMADEQANVSRNLLGIVKRLRSIVDHEGNVIDFDMHLMVTTTDFGSPLCDDVPGYAPARGAPVTAGCNARFAEFVTETRSVEDACTSVCPEDVVSGASYIAWGPNGTNVPDMAPLDVDGDGTPEDAIDRAVACTAAQGIVGCEIESPLEAMLQALNPDAEWNLGPEPFLREDAVLFVVIITDEPDCSAQEPAFVLDQTYMEIDPDTELPAPSSAVCWNAGVACEENGGGTYDSCTSIDGPLHDVDRYVSYLQTTFDNRVLLAIVTGVPEVTMHAKEAPHQPVAGGVLDLVYRPWVDGPYPAGDILPADDASGVTAVDQEFRFGIGPGCTTETRQATPPVRMRELCDAFNHDTLPRCRIESICDDDFSDIAHALARGPSELFPC